MNYTLFLIMLAVEPVVLMIFWSLAARQRPAQTIVGVCAIVAGVVVAIGTLGSDVPKTAYLAFAGMYLFSGLLWRWRTEGVTPGTWSVGEIAVAVLATTMLSSPLANPTSLPLQ